LGSTSIRIFEVETLSNGPVIISVVTGPMFCAEDRMATNNKWVKMLNQFAPVIAARIFKQMADDAPVLAGQLKSLCRKRRTKKKAK